MMASSADSAAFLHVMRTRGFLKDCTDFDALEAVLKAGTTTAYIGFDCTARSLHVGSLLQIMQLRWLQKTGHRPLVLMGGGTTRIGDPSGKDESRKLLSFEDIESNKQHILKVFDAYLDFSDAPDGAIMVDNAQWLTQWNYLDFLREIGPHFTINRMLTFDSVRQRLDREQPLTFLEFNYMLLQAYDFVELHRRYGVRLQIGGSDQWGNIVSGIELARRLDRAELFGITSPLLSTADGKKMGKTAQGAVWLNPELVEPYAFWQFWRNTADADVGRFLHLFTELPIEEIARLESLEGVEINEAKKILATEVTQLCHGKDAAIQAAEAAHSVFEQGSLAQGLPRVILTEEQLSAGIGIIDIFQQAGLAKSGKEAKRLVAEGGARIDDVTITDSNWTLTLENLSDKPRKLSAGKKRHAMIMRAGA